MADEPKLAGSQGGSEAPSSSPDVKQATPEMGEEEINRLLAQAEPRGDIKSAETVKPKAKVEETPAKEEKELSERAQKRLRELSRKVKEKAEEAETLRRQLEEVKKAGKVPGAEAVSVLEAEGLPPLTPPWETPEPGGVKEITMEEYRRDVAAEADRIVSMRLAQYDQLQAKAKQFEDDIHEVLSKYPELDDRSDKFDEKLSKKIAGLYQKAGGYKAGIRLKDFVEDIMEVREGSKEEGRAETAAKLAEQKAGAAVKPSAPSGEKRLSSEEALIEALKKGEISAEEAERYLPH